MSDPKQEPKDAPKQTSPEEPHIYSVSTNLNKPKFTRRSFIKAAAVASASVAISSCGYKIVIEPNTGGAATSTLIPPPNTAVPSPTDTPPPTPTDTPQPTQVPTDTPQPTQTPTETPEPTATFTATSVSVPATVNADNVNLRSGPETYYPSMGKLQKGTSVSVTHRISDSSWVYITVLTDYKQGWIKTTLLNVQANLLQSLPLMEPPPTPTPLPGHMGTTAAGSTGIDYQYTDQYGNIYTYTLPCGSPLPPGAVCICNCVTVPAACSCDSYSAPCSCDSHSSHYWYPN
jgi:hypothetical protein